MNISALTVGSEKRTIITLDGDLYKDAVKVPNYKDKWIIRLGSLHTVIAALKCLGKYVDGSGIEVAWEACGMYGSTTVNQILEGRHIYRGIYAHTVTFMALYSLYTKSILSDNDQELLQSLSSVDLDSEHQIGFKKSIQKIEEKLVEAALFEKLNLQADPSTPTAVFLCNYMRQVMNLLNYVGATRKRMWMQHLACTEEVSKYFHAHDQSNYLKWTLLYLADMLELRTTDPESWKFLEDGNFAVSKNKVPFTSIDPDHAIEHEHRPMKMKGGFINITCNENALDRYTLILPMLGQLAEEYKRLVLLSHSFLNYFCNLDLKLSMYVQFTL